MWLRCGNLGDDALGTNYHCKYLEDVQSNPMRGEPGLQLVKTSESHCHSRTLPRSVFGSTILAGTSTKRKALTSMCKEELKGFQDDWEDLAPCTDKHDSAEAFADSLHQRNV